MYINAVQICSRLKVCQTPLKTRSLQGFLKDYCGVFVLRLQCPEVTVLVVGADHVTKPRGSSQSFCALISLYFGILNL